MASDSEAAGSGETSSGISADPAASGSWLGNAFDSAGDFLREHGPYALLSPGQQETAQDAVGWLVDGNRAATPATSPETQEPDAAQSASAAASAPSAPATTTAPTPEQLAHASLICGYTAKDTPRQMDDFDLAQHFGLSPNIIAARPDDFYRRWVIQAVRQILPSAPEDCQAILDNPQGASAITLKLLANQKPDAQATSGPETDAGGSSTTAGNPVANKPPSASATSQRIKDVSDQIAELMRRPKGGVSQQELDDVLGQLHALRRAPDLTNTEHNYLVGWGLTAFTIAASHGLKTPQETVNDPLFADAAVGSMAFSGGGNSSLKAPGNLTGPVLPRTSSSFVATGGNRQPDEIPFHQHVESVKGNLPAEWGVGLPNRKGVGTRWVDPNNPGNRVRVDQGNANNSQSSQQDHHVIVHSDGKILGRDGKPIEGRIKDKPEDAHIPLKEYLTWKKWNSP